MSTRRVLGVLGLVLGCIGCDQESKHLAVEFLRGGPPVELCSGVVRLLYAENRGAWGSLGASWALPVKTLAFVVAPGLMLLALLVYALRVPPARWAVALGASLVVGGGVGNLWDRVRAGAVVDFMYVGVGRVGTNIFNVADVAVVAGVLLLLIAGRSRPAPVAAEQSAP